MRAAATARLVSAPGEKVGGGLWLVRRDCGEVFAGEVGALLVVVVDELVDGSDVSVVGKVVLFAGVVGGVTSSSSELESSEYSSTLLWSPIPELSSRRRALV